MVIEKVWQVWSYSKSWRIPNYQTSKPYKNLSFLLPDFRRNREKEFLNQEFYGQLPEQAWSKGSFDFSKIMPFGAPRSLIQMVSKWKGVFIEMDLLPTVMTNSFKIQNQTFEQHFYFLFFFCSDFMIMKFIPFFLEVSAKILNDKSIQNKVHSFYANADIKAVFIFLKKKHIHE